MAHIRRGYRIGRTSGADIDYSLCERASQIQEREDDARASLSVLLPRQG